MKKFDEIELVKKVTLLSYYEQIAFATAACSRQSIAFASSNDNSEELKMILSRLCVLVTEKGIIETPEWQKILEKVMQLLPGEQVHSTIRYVLLEDAVSSLAYAIRCVLRTSPQEAVWAARHAYEATDQAAIKALNLAVGDSNFEEKINNHEFVQRELSRQDRDIGLLVDGAVEAVIKRSQIEELLTEQELAFLEKFESVD